MRRAELNEIVVVAAYRARRLANGLDFDAGDRRQGTGKKLVLHFPSDRDFIFQALALVLLFDERADRTRHLIEGVA